MDRIRYSALIGLSYLGTRYLGLEKTIGSFRQVGLWWRKLGLTKEKDIARIREALNRSYDSLPLSVRCLDQALVTWHVLNLHGYPAEMKIGVTVAPFMSHAWVEAGKESFVNSVYIPDMQVVAQYPSW